MPGSGTLIELGFCTRAHGLKGGFTFNLYNKDNSVLTEGSVVTLFPNSSNGSISSIRSEGEEFKISKISFGNKVIVYLDGILDINIVEEMVPFVIKVERETFPVTEDDEYYISDLVGLNVIDPITRNELGKIYGSYDNGAQVVFEIELKNGKRIDVPFVGDFFKNIDIEKGEVELILPQVVEV